jgi:outer membrane receptor protein involved in Fe transport
VKSTFLDGRARVNADFYYSDYTNIDENVLVTVGGVSSTTTINAAKATIDGVEFSGTIVPVEHLTLFLNYGLIHGKFGQYFNGNVNHTGDRWPGPTSTIDLGASYTLPLSFGSLTLNGDWNWQSKVFLYGDETNPWCSTAQIGAVPGCIAYVTDQSLNQYAPAQSLVNARLTLHLNAYDVDVSLWARNILDNQQIFGLTDFASTAGGACSGAGPTMTCTVNPLAKFGNGYRQGYFTSPRTFGLEIVAKIG